MQWSYTCGSYNGKECDVVQKERQIYRYYIDQICSASPWIYPWGERRYDDSPEDFSAGIDKLYGIDVREKNHWL